MDTAYPTNNPRKIHLASKQKKGKNHLLFECAAKQEIEKIFQIHFVVLLRFAWESFTCLVINPLIHPLKKESIFTHFMSNAYPYFIYRIFMSICWKVSIERKRINKIDSSEVYIFLINLYSTPFHASYLVSYRL